MVIRTHPPNKDFSTVVELMFVMVDYGHLLEGKTGQKVKASMRIITQVGLKQLSLVACISSTITSAL